MANYTATIRAKGRLVIPSGLREALDITPSSRILIQREGNRLILEPVNKQFVRETRGMTASNHSLCDALIQQRREEDQRSK